MNSKQKNKNNSGQPLKPELAFEWIKYKKSTHEKSFIKEAVNHRASEKVQDQSHKNKISPQPVTFSKESFKGDPSKERLYLWYSAILETKEMTMDDFSKIIQMPDLIETEEFLFRHPPLRFSYLWRGKALKFSDETITKLQEVLKE